AYNKEIARNLAKTNQEDLPITITFNKPLGQEALKRFEKEYGLKVKELIGRAFGINNERITFAVRENNVDSIDWKIVQEVVNGNGYEAEVAGVFAVEATIANTKSLEKLISENSV